ncbi:calpain-7-like [Elysia marginata]|uniref:Calpain-7-like n=1 Tax=Elysia marginata TaxID=1093978 RepID=A0AAV4HF16_9GAST|nr:calpain-7-like [Elysia marginata]
MSFSVIPISDYRHYIPISTKDSFGLVARHIWVIFASYRLTPIREVSVFSMTDPISGYHGADPQVLQDEGIHLAQQAVQHDQLGRFEMAVFYYSEAAQTLLAALQAGSQVPNIAGKAAEYMLRADTLKKSLQASSKTASNEPLKTQQQTDLEKAGFLLTEALDEDEQGNISEAVDLYSEAVQLCLKIVGKVVPPLGFGAFGDDDDSSTKQRLVTSGPNSPKPSNKTFTPSGKRGLINVGPSSYSKEEIAVLRSTSKINGREYVPFLAVDQREKFAFPIHFEDKDGKLALSPKQRQNFGKWAAPESFCDDPKIIIAVSSFSIRQTIVSDCSFVASLAISAQYEKRFRKKLITNIIYPQNRNGEPVYNPCGKYMVKLNLNGVWRKVIIDDFLPTAKYGDLLCSFSNNKNELWVSLLEKAYMKVMGGYDFPGSNSNIDLHALTEWIPERVAIRPGSSEFDKDREFKRLLDRFHKGHCLVTVATGELSEAEADRAGLVPTHAYAMLDVKEHRGLRLLMLKNPWNHLRWKGRYCEKDAGHWTPDLQKALNYDPTSAQMFDNGVFWIDYDSLCHFFDVFYINWNPELFTYTTCMQHTWFAKEGPKKDTYNISDNPQYRLQVKGNQPSAAIWILLSRHITDKADFADNKEFITVLVYKNGGKKVFYPYDPPPYKDGVRINSPHYLCKLVENTSDPYTLVISQYEKNNTTHYTLRVYSTVDFTLTRFPNPYKKQYEKRVHLDNQSTDNHLMLELLGPKQYSVGIEVICVSENVSNAPGAFQKTTSGDFRPGYCVLQLSSVSGGVYNVRVCTFRAGREGPFFLDFSSSAAYSIKQLQ